MPEPHEESPPKPWWRRRHVRGIVLGAALLLAALPSGIAAHYYVKFARRIDAKLAAGPFATTVNLFAAPETVTVGDAVPPAEFAARLRRAGYGTSDANPIGWFKLAPDAVEIFPGRQSYFAHEPAVIRFEDGKISRIVSLKGQTDFQKYRLEPQFITNISGKQRARRRLVRFPEIPPALVQAVISVEDKNFFRHSGFDYLRILKAAYVDLREGRKEQGASTLSMQLTRSLWLDPRKNWRRKISELLMTLHLEERLTKEEIFETYANQIYLGRRGTFNINGFGEGARVFFGKEIGRLTLPEAATLAGMVQRPAYFNPLRYPERARERRNVVLGLMRQNGYITAAEYKSACASPLAVAGPSADPFDTEAQYFLDLVNDELQGRFGGEGGARQVYTTLDWRLQRAANEAVHTALARVDQALRKKGVEVPPNQPQVALVALDPHTGEIKAFVGGRNYAASQIDHALAERQPGSIFKPFVYAAALDTALGGGPLVLTPATMVVDQPTIFTYANQTYAPDNFQERFLGAVSLRRALVQSLNVATVKVAESAGYGRVVAMAQRVGLKNAAATPAVALGAYEQNALEMAAAYTVFANQGVYVSPTGISMVRSPGGRTLYRQRLEQRPALDARVAWLVTNMMQDVLRSGTGRDVRRLGFNLPAAGKTGTSRDGWFAGFTSKLLCVVWVGFDDNRDLELEGARSALPVWTEFMKRAAQLREYGDVRDFPAPPGIVRVAVCPDSGHRAGLFCPSEINEAFIDGTQPEAECSLHSPPEDYADRAVVLPPAGLTPEPVAATPAVR